MCLLSLKEPFERDKPLIKGVPFELLLWEEELQFQSSCFTQLHGIAFNLVRDFV